MSWWARNKYLVLVPLIVIIILLILLLLAPGSGGDRPFVYQFY